MWMVRVIGILFEDAHILVFLKAILCKPNLSPGADAVHKDFFVQELKHQSNLISLKQREAIKMSIYFSGLW